MISGAQVGRREIAAQNWLPSFSLRFLWLKSTTAFSRHCLLAVHLILIYLYVVFSKHYNRKNDSTEKFFVSSFFLSPKDKTRPCPFFPFPSKRVQTYSEPTKSQHPENLPSSLKPFFHISGGGPEKKRRQRPMRRCKRPSLSIPRGPREERQERVILSFPGRLWDTIATAVR